MLLPRVAQQDHRRLLLHSKKPPLPQWNGHAAQQHSTNNNNTHHADGVTSFFPPIKCSNSSSSPFNLGGSRAILLVALCLGSVVLLSLSLSYLLHADGSWSPFFSSLPHRLWFPPGLSLSPGASFHPSYHRCDLLPNKFIARSSFTVDFDWTLSATCYRYTGEETNEEEISYSKETKEDSLYLTVLHDHGNTESGLHAACGADVNSGCYTVIHDNCDAQINHTAIVEEDAQVAEVIRQRYGPTSFELRIEGEELLTLPLVHIPHSEYRDYHYKLLNQSVRPSSAMLAAVNPNAANTIPAADFSRGTRRILGSQRCLYTVNYSMSITGYYQIKLYIMYADFESISSRAKRKSWPRPQNGLVRTDQRYLLPSNMYSPPTTFDPFSHTSAQQQEQGSMPSASPYAILDTPIEFRGRKWNLTVPLYRNPALVGRWISRHHSRFHAVPDVNAITSSTVVASSTNINSSSSTSDTALIPTIQSQAWWSNNLALKSYSQEKRALATFCQHLDITLYDFLPYCASHTRFSFSHATRCFGGKRFAFLGDSQTRTLIGRFVSIFLGTEYKFRKQPFRGNNPHHQPVEWECAIVPIPQNEKQVKRTQVGGDTQFAFGLPQDTDNSTNATAASTTTTTGLAANVTMTPLTPYEFELCYFPIGLFYWETGEVIASAMQSQEFTLILLNSGQHPLSHGWHAKRYSQMMAEMFADIEERLMLGMDANSGTTVEPHVLSAISSSPNPPTGYVRSSLAAAAHMQVQSQLLWWNTLYLPRILSLAYLGRKEAVDGRTVQRSDLFNSVARGMLRVWNFSLVDGVNDGVLTFIDCSDGRGHAEWPVFDTIFYAIYRGMHNKLQCKL